MDIIGKEFAKDSFTNGGRGEPIEGKKPYFKPSVGRITGKRDLVAPGECLLRAYTSKPISGAAIGFIPEGTPFVVSGISLLEMDVGWKYSWCKGLPINQIYNDEFVLVDDPWQMFKEFLETLPDKPRYFMKGW